MCQPLPLPQRPMTCFALGLHAFGFQTGQKLMCGAWLQILVKCCIYELGECAGFHCCGINVSMLPEGDVRTVVSSSKAALHCCNDLPLVQVLTVIYITATVRSFFKIKATIPRAWFTVSELSMGCRAWETKCVSCSRAGCAPRPAHTIQDCCSAFSSEMFLLNTFCHTLLCTSPARWIFHTCVFLGQSFV